MKKVMQGESLSGSNGSTFDILQTIMPPRYSIMNGRVQRDILKRLKRIESSNFNVDDIELLLIRIRPYLNEGTSLRDIADFIAHNDRRIKGLSHKHILEMFSPIVKKRFQNQQDYGAEPLITQEQVVRELINFLENFEFGFLKDRIKLNSNKIMLCILYVLQGIEFEFTIENQMYYGQICSLTSYKGNTALQFLFVEEINDTKNEFVFIALEGNHPFSWEAIKKLEDGAI